MKRRSLARALLSALMLVSLFAPAVAAAKPAPSVPSGILYGTALTPGGTALSGVKVDVYSLSRRGWTTKTSALTAADGTYSFTLAPGTYRLGFSKAGLINEFWNDAATVSAASDLVIQGADYVNANAVLLSPMTRDGLSAIKDGASALLAWSDGVGPYTVSRRPQNNIYGTWTPIATISTTAYTEIVTPRDYVQYRVTDALGQYVEADLRSKPATLVPVASVPVDSSTNWGTARMAFDESAGRYYVASGAGQALFAIDAVTRQIVGQVPLEMPPYAIACDSANGRVYVNGSNVVYEYSTSDLSLLRSIPATGAYTCLALDPARGKAYTEAPGYDSINVIDLTSGAVTVRSVTELPASTYTNSTWALEVDRDRGVLYVAAGYTATFTRALSTTDESDLGGLMGYWGGCADMLVDPYNGRLLGAVYSGGYSGSIYNGSIYGLGQAPSLSGHSTSAMVMDPETGSVFKVGAGQLSWYDFGTRYTYAPAATTAIGFDASSIAYNETADEIAVLDVYGKTIELYKLVSAQ